MQADTPQPTPSTDTRYLTLAELEAGLPAIRQSPQQEGELAMIVRRPAIEQREVLAAGQIDRLEGLVGDCWRSRGNKRTPDGAANPDAQLTLMNARVLGLLAGTPERWPLAGDQLIVDLDLSEANLPPGSRLAIGDAVVEITALPHTGCGKFLERYGKDAVRFVNSEQGKALRLRGVNARVVAPGAVAVGQVVRKVL